MNSQDKLIDNLGSPSLNKKWLVGFLAMLWCGIVVDSASSQSVYLERKALLEGQQRETRNTIDQIAIQLQRSQSLLDVTLKEVDQQFRLASQLSRQIRLQEEKIRAIEQQITQSNQNIQMIEADIVQLEQDIDEAIEDYKETLTYVYKFGKMNTLSVILTAPSLNTMLSRSVYLKTFRGVSRSSGGTNTCESSESSDTHART
jgi:peptidoglycan hydrolase CwlO-like protein